MNARLLAAMTTTIRITEFYGNSSANQRLRAAKVKDRTLTLTDLSREFGKIKVNFFSDADSSAHGAKA